MAQHLLRKIRMRVFFNLPNRLALTLFFVVLCLAFIFNITPEDFKFEFYCAIIIFVFSSFLSGMLIRMGKLEPIKNTVNALWNFETACAFCYGLYLFYNYALSGITQPDLMSSWARENLITFVVMSNGLASVAIFRASISITEIFKDSIARSKPIGAKKLPDASNNN